MPYYAIRRVYHDMLQQSPVELHVMALNIKDARRSYLTFLGYESMSHQCLHAVHDSASSIFEAYLLPLPIANVIFISSYVAAPAHARE